MVAHLNINSLRLKCDSLVQKITGNVDILTISKGASKIAATSEMERFVIIVNGWKPLTIITKRSILDAAAVLDPPLISETKLDKSQFLIEGYSRPYRIDRNCHVGGIILYVRADIPSKLLFTELLPMEGFYVETNLQKKKWLLSCSCNPNKNAIKSHL